MPLFKISSAMTNDMVRAFGEGLGHTVDTGLIPAGSRFKILKGAVPTQSEIDLNTSTSFRSGDVLIDAFIDVGTTTLTNDTITRKFELKTAIATGTASWFMWHGTGGSGASLPMIRGIITLPGGGGDLTLTNLTITNGLQYDFGPVTFTLPRNFSY